MSEPGNCKGCGKQKNLADGYCFQCRARKAARGRTHPIPEAKDGFLNCRDIATFIPVAGYSVAEWYRLPNGQGKPEAVCVRLMLADALDGAEVVMRIKSREEFNRLIEVLERHRDNVWPALAEENA